MRLDPVASTRASAYSLNHQLARFSNELEKALAAYNGGEVRLATLHQPLAGARFWDPELCDAVPAETLNYVPGRLAAACLFLHPEEYGLEFPDLEGGAAPDKPTGRPYRVCRWVRSEHGALWRL